MENYRIRLTEHAKAPQPDIDKMVEEIQDKEILLDAQKRAKALAFKELRGIEKKLAKL